MTRFLTLILVISLFMTISVVAQVTIGTDDLPIDFGTIINRATTDELYVTVDIGPAGVDQTWDFTGMVTPDTWNELWVDPAQTAGTAEFPTATHAHYTDEIPDIIYYWETTTSNHLMIGAWSSMIVMEMNNPLPADNFPLSYEDEWMGVTELPSPFGGSVEVDTTWGWVDGWGTLIDVTGSHSCLRIKTHERSWTVTMGIPEFPVEFWHYYWYVPGGAGWVAITSEADEPNPNFTSGQFVRTAGLTGGIHQIPGWTAMPTEVILQPAFPNPFNPETNLTFNLPTSGNVTLSIFDSQGRLVADLQNGWMTPGSYQAQFKADNLSSGMYFARLTSGGISQMQKLVLVK